MPMGAFLAIINPEKLHEDLTPSTPLLTQIDADDQVFALYSGGIMPMHDAVDLEKSNALLKLPPTLHRLNFNFTALSFAAPENISFRYKLDGLDNNWSKPGSERSATYS